MSSKAERGALKFIGGAIIGAVAGVALAKVLQKESQKRTLRKFPKSRLRPDSRSLQVINKDLSQEERAVPAPQVSPTETPTISPVDDNRYAENSG